VKKVKASREDGARGDARPPPTKLRTLVIRNRQRTKALHVPLLRRLAREVIDEELYVQAYELCLHLVDAPEMAGMNEQYLQHTGSTDVITFDLGDSEHGASGPMLGEIFISIPDAVKQAREFRTTWQAELARYLIHGLLHLRGYDDLEPDARRVMKREEGRLLRKVAGRHDLKQIGK
jgi:probable rRNA maturation factor